MASQSMSNHVAEIMAALERDPRIDIHHYPVSVLPKGDGVVLEGTVKNIAARKLALAAAKGILRGLELTDGLRVAAAESKGDGALRDEVANLLLNEPVFADYGLRVSSRNEQQVLRQPRSEEGRLLSVTVQDGTVTLEGSVGSLSHRRLAEALMWWTASCQAVDNRLMVFPREEDNPGEVSDAIRMLWEKDPLVHEGQLTVDVKDGAATLNGYVASQEEKHLAAMDAWCIPGVEEVVDRIEARL